MTILEFILNNKDYLEDLVTRSTYHSNAIEGSTLTYAETYAILYNDNSFKIEGKEPREIYEAINHKKALELVFKNLQNKEEFDERFIKKLNETINRDIKDTESYRAVQVFIQGSEHIPPEPEKVPNLMMYYIYNYNHEEQDIFTKIARYHIEFERIHPFEDGNGRTARLWQNVILLNWEPLFEYVPIESEIKKYQEEYYKVIQKCNTKGDSTEFIEFMLKMIDEVLDGIIIGVNKQINHISTYVRKILEVMEPGVNYTTSELMKLLNLKSRISFRENYLIPAIENGFVKMTLPNTPTSKNQAYYKD